MIASIIRKPTIASARSYISKLIPMVNIHINDDSPLPSVKIIKGYAKTVSQINGLESQMGSLSNEQLRAKTDEFRQKITTGIQKDMAEVERLRLAYMDADGIDKRHDLKKDYKKAEEALFEAKQRILNQILPEAFAVVREVGKRLLNMRHYDVQLIGGMCLHYGNIAEMTTGEGKTLVATLPTYLNAISGDGVHVVTVNDYLARRDCEWMSTIYKFLGLTVGVIQHSMNPQERQVAYGADITYGTNNEFGFDYLRDNMVMFKDEMVQRPHHFAVVDEVDSILVDEARTPLIISGPAEESTDKYYTAYEISGQLKGCRVTEADEIDAKHRGEDLSVGYDYVADEKNKSVSLTDQGEDKAAQLFGVENLHDMETVEYRHHVLNSIRAKEFFRRDTDYVVNDGKVIIVDEFTGRMMPGRRWSDGLHQAIEAREGIKIERENQTLATITFQNYFRMYKKLSGMTGTAYTEANEFKQIYELDVLVIPTNRPLQRQNHPDCIFRTQKEKYDAVVEEIQACHKTGQPVLVGTVSIEKSEYIGQLLQAKAVPHRVLNAKYHEMEATIVSQAGRFGAVTIATNMAGRGTDIMLGGNPEFMARALAQQKVDEAKKNNQTEPDMEALVESLMDEFKDQARQEHDKVVDTGGLHIMGTERHESRRIDNQLRGRSGRQGDPGESRFFVSLDDDLMRLFAGDRIKMLMDRFGFAEGEVIESSMVSNAIEIAQKRVEGYNFEIRKQLLEYDSTMNKQREVIYSLRKSIIDGENTRDLILESVYAAIEDAVRLYLFNDAKRGEKDVSALSEYFKNKFGLELPQDFFDLSSLPFQSVVETLYAGLQNAYQHKEEKFGIDQIRSVERMFLLHTIDGKWKEHLYEMDRLKEGVGLRALGQKDPVVEYKREGYHMFQLMFESIHGDVAEMIFRLQPVEGQPQVKRVFDNRQEAVHQDFSGITGVARMAASKGELSPEAARQTRAHQASQPSVQPKVGRNELCPCGSGKKYKKCCGQ